MSINRGMDKDKYTMEYSKVKVLAAQLCLNLCDTMDCSPPGCSVHGILQARILEWVAIPFSRESSWPKDQTWVSCIAGRLFTVWATREIHTMEYCRENPIDLQPQEGWHFAFCSNMDRLWGYDVQWNKPDREGQISYDITYMWNLKNTAN